MSTLYYKLGKTRKAAAYIKELVIDVTDNKFIFVNCGVYFKWVLKTIKSID